MLTSKQVLLLILFSVLAGCVSTSSVAVSSFASAYQPRAPLFSPVSAQYEVYEAVLKELSSGNPDATFVIEERTSSDVSNLRELNKTIKFLAEKFPTLSRSALIDYRTKNKASSALKNLFRLRVVLISEREQRRILREAKGWDVFREKYGAGGITTFSNVGISSGLNQAVVYVGYRRGWLDGVGRYVMLIKEAGAWKVQSKVDVWYS